MSREREPWFSALKADLQELATNPTDYDEDVIVPVARDALSVIEELCWRLHAACEPCAECGHIDWRELDDILASQALQRRES